MSEIAFEGSNKLARGNPASQRRPRGPHPLPLFLNIATKVADGDARRLQAILAGVRSYQAHPYVRAIAEPPVASRVGNARLLDYGGIGPVVVFVPSLVNPPYVLDLAPGNSLLRWLAGQGLRVLLVDWGEPEDLSIEGSVTERLVPLLREFDRPMLAGYCLGGTMALMAATLIPVTKLALIATPWRFSGYAPDRQMEIARYWHSVRPAAERLGVLPMDLLQPAFWALDEQDAVSKFLRFGTLDPISKDARSFVALEDWAQDGPPLSLPAAAQLFDDFLAADLPGTGRWCPANPATLGFPILNLVSIRDRLVPAAAAPLVGERHDIDAGHVGMIVGHRAPDLVWERLRDWLSS